MMATIFDVAKYILSKTGKISTWKLQKLCYYSQAWSLAWTENELFSEDFQAWVNGPVCPELFQEHKGMFSIQESDLNKGNLNVLDSNQKETIDVIIKDYGSLEPYILREQTHSEEPWKSARGDTPDGVYSCKIITKDSMGEYYGSL